jgi:hypothetical protein
VTEQDVHMHTHTYRDTYIHIYSKRQVNGADVTEQDVSLAVIGPDTEGSTLTVTLRKASGMYACMYTCAYVHEYMIHVCVYVCMYTWTYVHEGMTPRAVH